MLTILLISDSWSSRQGKSSNYALGKFTGAHTELCHYGPRIDFYPSFNRLLLPGLIKGHDNLSPGLRLWLRFRNRLIKPNVIEVHLTCSARRR
jgi:hypothetical protein